MRRAPALTFTAAITLDQVRAELREQATDPEQNCGDWKKPHVWYGANSCWWTHNHRHLSVVVSPRGKPWDSSVYPLSVPGNLEMARAHGRRVRGHMMPCDPAGGVLYYTDDCEGFLFSAESKRHYYGTHQLRAFMAAHHQNCVNGAGEPWLSTEWKDYNAAIDRYDTLS